MKTSKIILTLLTALLLFASVSFAQVKVYTDGDSRNNAESFYVSSVAVDTNATVYSKWFSAQSYLGNSFYTYPVTYDKIQTSTLGKPYITVTLQGSNDLSNIVTIDTIGTVSDSLETLYTGTTDLNNKKFLFYRLKFVGEEGNRSDAVINRLDLLFTRPKN